MVSSRLLIFFLIVSVQSVQPRKRKLCGRVLVQTLIKVCSPDSNSPPCLDDSKSQDASIVDLCCKGTCSADEIAGFCCNEEDARKFYGDNKHADETKKLAEDIKKEAILTSQELKYHTAYRMMNLVNFCDIGQAICHVFSGFFLMFPVFNSEVQPFVRVMGATANSLWLTMFPILTILALSRISIVLRKTNFDRTGGFVKFSKLLLLLLVASVQSVQVRRRRLCGRMLVRALVQVCAQEIDNTNCMSSADPVESSILEACCINRCSDEEIAAFCCVQEKKSPEDEKKGEEQQPVREATGDASELPETQEKR
ncbi:unnamed protein product [Caenorhabditis auriculariae]|uniref:Insulin-like domain-containing protein n=1 Tax=Caenorhabditis auriculariae TaxID=2777116 RepID=A0A8S1HC57_9PELO|nr:unnamed protein product [Caenorhabditis auriculariae]